MVITQETVSLKKIPQKEKEVDGLEASFERISLVTQVALLLCLKYLRCSALCQGSQFVFCTNVTTTHL